MSGEEGAGVDGGAVSDTSPGELLEDAIEHRDHGRFDKALELARAHLEDNPDDAYAEAFLEDTQALAEAAEEGELQLEEDAQGTRRGDSTPEPSKGGGCPKCGHTEASAEEITATGTGLSRFFDVQHHRYKVVSCDDCGYSELYRARDDAGVLVDLFLEG